MNKWTNVKDILPKEDGKYLVLVQKTITISVYYKGFFYKSRLSKRYYKNWLTEDKKYSQITHWMPLPELPK